MGYCYTGLGFQIGYDNFCPSQHEARVVSTTPSWENLTHGTWMGAAEDD